MIALTDKKVSLESFLSIVQQSKESLEVLEQLEIAKTHSDKCPPVSSLLASYLISDLYSEQSSNEANINRITTNLDAAADDLMMISKLVRSLRNA
jgi:hypothetical protein